MLEGKRRQRYRDWAQFVRIDVSQFDDGFAHAPQQCFTALGIQIAKTYSGCTRSFTYRRSKWPLG
jgi:predicted alpha/beta hydrolase